MISLPRFGIRPQALPAALKRDPSILIVGSRLDDYLIAINPRAEALATIRAKGRGMLYRDRSEAAARLADALAGYCGQDPLVVAIPRGAVPMAKIIADRLGAGFDVVLTRKLRAPGNPEFAIGAVDETGWTYIGDYASEAASPHYIEAEVAAELEIIRERRARYTPARAPIDAAGRVVIVVDDGLATGSTMVAALHAMHARGARRLVCAVPVGSREAVSKVRRYADEVVCLQTPEPFYAVGRFYSSFPQVSDEEVIRLLGSGVGPGLRRHS
jgi:predicted phosphoribosyltransferase